MYAVALTVTAEFVRYFPSLKVVTNVGVGYNNIDLQVCKENGVRVGYTPNDTTADMAMALLLTAGRRVVEGDVVFIALRPPSSICAGTAARLVALPLALLAWVELAWR